MENKPEEARLEEALRIVRELGKLEYPGGAERARLCYAATVLEPAVRYYRERVREENTLWKDQELRLQTQERRAEQAEAREAALNDLLRRNVIDGYPMDIDDGYCFHCEVGYDSDEDNDLEEPQNHKPKCAWRQAKEYLAQHPAQEGSAGGRNEQLI